MKSLKHIFLVLLVAFSFVACEEDVTIVHNLEERDANEIVVLLAQHNIIAKKQKNEKNQEVSWGIQVGPDNQMTAMSILVANHLPKIKHGGLKGICEDIPTIQTRKIEKCREILGLKGEIINSLENIPGVVKADIVLNIPDKVEFPTEDTIQPRPTASVTIEILSEEETVKMTEGKVQQFVANSVNGLDARDVSVLMSYKKAYYSTPKNSNQDQVDVSKQNSSNKQVTKNNNDKQAKSENNDPEDDSDISEDDTSLTTVGGLKLDESSAKKLKIVGALFLVLFLLIAAAFIFVLLKMSKLRKSGSVSAVTVNEDGDSDQKYLEA